MKILIVASEMAPFAKTGGLADVIGALPSALAGLGHDVVVAMPYYGCIKRDHPGATKVLSDIGVDLPVGPRTMNVWTRELATDGSTGGSARLMLIEDDGLFDRPELYHEAGHDYADNPLRFGYFCLATFWMIKGLAWTPNVILGNDWQTALLPVYRDYHPAVAADPELHAIPVVFAIHNMSFQGIHPIGLIDLLGLPWSAWDSGALEFYGQVNLLKGALMCSDWLTTVSPTYAREIQRPEYGHGLDGVLHESSARLTGILNGIDTSVWNPAEDELIAANFTRSRLAGKKKCKLALQERLGLTVDADAPLIGMVTRLTGQKGIELLPDVLPQVLDRGDVQLALLGNGNPTFEVWLEKLRELYPNQVGITLGFDNALAHQIEAGADMFLMPSQFEPCGLNQMYSLRYGTVPIVRRTGGLADTVVNVTPKALKDGEATGFVFRDFAASALLNALRRALKLYRTDRKTWQGLMRSGMLDDFTWTRSARAYVQVAQRAIRARESA